jgi:hypothetical protein
MKKRRIPATALPTMKVTDSSPPNPSASKSRPLKRRRTAVKVNYSTPSEVLVNTALAQTGHKKAAKKRRVVKRKKTVEKTTSQKRLLESKIRKHKF